MPVGGDALAEVVALDRRDVGGAERAAQDGILAVGLLDPPPPGVAGDVEDRREGEAGADGHHLLADDPTDLA